MPRRIAFSAVLFWALSATIFLFLGNPFPIPDRGHRAFGVADERSARILVQLLTNRGLGEKYTFDFGPTHQTLLTDNLTVIMRVNPVEGLRDLSRNAISLVVADPLKAAKSDGALLRINGFKARVIDVHEVDEAIPPNKLVILDSNILDSAVLVYRLHVFKMGKPPIRKLLD